MLLPFFCLEKMILVVFGVFYREKRLEKTRKIPFFTKIYFFYMKFYVSNWLFFTIFT